MGAWEGWEDGGSNGLWCGFTELEVPGQQPSECGYVSLNLSAEVEAGKAA